MIYDIFCTDAYRYDTGVISGILAMPYWQKLFSTGYRDSTGHLSVTASQSAEIVSILSAGTFFGALSAAPIADRIGRRLGMIYSIVVLILGVILQTAATAIPLFVSGRFFAGLGVGSISALGNSPRKARMACKAATLVQWVGL
jgi:MFS transporter, SP family, sugar:H+ symporter